MCLASWEGVAAVRASGLKHVVIWIQGVSSSFQNYACRQYHSPGEGRGFPVSYAPFPGCSEVPQFTPSSHDDLDREWVHHQSWKKDGGPKELVGGRGAGPWLLHLEEWCNVCHLLRVYCGPETTQSTLHRSSLIFTNTLKIRHHLPPFYRSGNWVQERLSDCPCLAPKSILLELQPRFISGCV